jgi:hypothetical protein
MVGTSNRATPFFRMRQLQRFDPGDVVVLADALDQLFPNLPPGFVRHSLTCQSRAGSNPALHLFVPSEPLRPITAEGRLRQREHRLVCGTERRTSNLPDNQQSLHA